MNNQNQTKTQQQDCGKKDCGKQNQSQNSTTEQTR